MTQKFITTLRFILFAAAVIFIIAGLFRGEAQIVLTKAVYICLECIGIG